MSQKYLTIVYAVNETSDVAATYHAREWIASSYSHAIDDVRALKKENANLRTDYDAVRLEIASLHAKLANESKYAAQAAPVSRDWFPVDGNTRGYKGDIVLRHYKQKDHYRLGHTDWIGAHEVTPYSPSGTAKPVAAWKGTIERMGLDTWMPLGDFTAQAAPVDTESVLDAAIAAKQGGANG